MEICYTTLSNSSSSWRTKPLHFFAPMGAKKGGHALTLVIGATGHPDFGLELYEVFGVTEKRL